LDVKMVDPLVACLAVTSVETKADGKAALLALK
jgi:hypothetical protein